MARKKKPPVTPPTRGGARASWRGMVRFGLVAFPVEGFNAHVREAGEISLHLLHAGCGRRIRYEKQCPVHGPVTKDEIVSAYEYEKGKYVEIDPAELDALRSPQDRALTIDTFLGLDDFDPIFFDGRMYYLVPDGAAAWEPFSVLLVALERQRRCGLGQVVFSGKEQIALVRPYHGVLQMALLNYEVEMRRPEQVAVPLPEIKAGDRRVQMAEQIIRNWTDPDFDFSQYADRYLEKLRALIDAKVAGREVVAPSAEAEPEVINLMDALRKSMSAKSPAARPRTSAKAKPKRAKPSGTARTASRRQTKAG